MRKFTAIIVPIFIFLSCGGGKVDPVETAKSMEDLVKQTAYIEKSMQQKLTAEQYETLSYMLAKNYLQEEAWDKMVDLAASVYRRSDAGATALNFIALNLLEKDMYADKALLAAEKAVALTRSPNPELKPEDLSEAAFQQRMKWRLSSYLDTYGWALWKNEKMEEAEKALEEAESFDEENTDVLVHLSKLRLQMGKPEQAYNSAVKAIIYGEEAANNLAKEAYLTLKQDDKNFDKTLKKSLDDLRAEQYKALVDNQLDIKAPDFTLIDINGDTVKLSDYGGKIVFLDFWATWCPPCRKELPILQSTVDRYKSQGVIFLAVSTDKEKEKVIPFIRENNYTFTVLYDDGAKRAYDVAGIPTLFIIDAQGIIRYKHIGFRPDVGDIWARQIEKLRER